ncbi:MAG: hypothetical protein SFX72_02430 [Isosphaeraceae bacterium]|nr:hypothetical protein [Isosphaeraceae bacterium]
MTKSPRLGSDPDRPLRLGGVGSQEWWYFDAISDDGRDALVVVWYLGLPFDPRYGLAALGRLRDPASAFPDPLDHSGVGLSWYRDGKTLAYALHTYPRRFVRIDDDPFEIEIGPTRLSRVGSEYRMRLDLPNLDGGGLSADLAFHATTLESASPFELGPLESRHVWIPAAVDTRVEGRVEVAGKRRSVDFLGRGYHDHNAGDEELSAAWKSWGWDRVHFDRFTAIHYDATPRRGPRHTPAILCRDGRAVVIRDSVEPLCKARAASRLRLRYPAELEVPGATVASASDGESIEVPRITRRHSYLVDDGPFYLRWVSEFDVEGFGRFPGISEWFEGDRLNSRWFNWMIPYRLKRPWG